MVSKNPKHIFSKWSGFFHGDGSRGIESVKKNHLKKNNHKDISIWVFPKIGFFPPKSSIFIRFSMIFTIHFGVLFSETSIWTLAKSFYIIEVCQRTWDSGENSPHNSDSSKTRLVGNQSHDGSMGRLYIYQLARNINYSCRQLYYIPLYPVILRMGST